MTTSATTASDRGYRILAQLGQGGMAKIQLAIRQGPGGFRKLFVVKQLRPDLANETYAKMFLHEARLAALLSHPNIVQSYEVGQELDNCYLEMEYLEGQTLARLVRRATRKELPLEIHLFILTELLAALAHVHQLNDLAGNHLSVVHRDVSPGNLFLTYDGQVKLLDFGIAKSIELVDLPGLGSVKGKLAYMSPEQARAGQVDQRSDLYSVGIMLWEAVACQPFVERGESSQETLEKRKAGKIRSIETLCPEIDPALLEICQKALSLEPAQRFQSAQELRAHLLDFLRKRNGQPTREAVAQVVQQAFGREKVELEKIISDKIFSPDSSPDSLISDALFRGGGSTSMGRSQEEASNSGLGALAFNRSLLPKVALGAVGVAAILLIAVNLMRSDDSPKLASTPAPALIKAAAPVLPVATAAAVPVRASARPKAPERIRFSLKVSPPQARIALDGQNLGRGSINKTLSKDRKEHILTVQLKGYQPIERRLRFSKDLTMELVLAPEAQPDPEPLEEPEVTETGKRRRRGGKPQQRSRSTDGSQPTEKPSGPEDSKPNARPRFQAGDHLPTATPTRRAIDKENPYK